MRLISLLSGAAAGFVVGAGSVAQPVPARVSAPRSVTMPRGFRASPPAAARAGEADGKITFTVTFDDPAGALAGYTDQIRSAILGAGAVWARVLGASGSIEIVVVPGAIPRTTGRSLTSVFVRNNGQYDVYDQGMAGELRTGEDPNGADPDVEITIGSDYLVNELWFDPDPIHRTAPVPMDRTDAVSVFTHELGHAIGFNGWRDQSNGSLPATYESTYDEPIFFDGNFWFGGAQASGVYGGAVPLTFGTYQHLGNSPPRPGENLIPDLMNGVVFYRGTRYYVSALDLAVLTDAGVLLQPACYANCDGSTAAPVLNVNDFICFQAAFAGGNTYANCDGSTATPVLNVNDFICFQARFAAGCP